MSQATCGGRRAGLRTAGVCKVRGSMALSDERTKAIPWTESVVPGNRLLYMPFLEYQLEYMRKNVEGLKELPFEEHLSMQKSSRKPGIIESWQYESKDYRKIRLTYIDCGIGAQVFNSVWYPRYNTDAPIFGIDFLAFGPKKVLAILDLQPLTQDPAYLEKYIDPLIPLRNKYQDLCGRMSGKFYDEVQFFSRQLLFGRFDNDGPVMESLFPAFKEYLEYYTTMVRALEKDDSPSHQALVEELHRAYDQYRFVQCMQDGVWVEIQVVDTSLCLNAVLRKTRLLVFSRPTGVKTGQRTSRTTFCFLSLCPRRRIRPRDGRHPRKQDTRTRQVTTRRPKCREMPRPRAACTLRRRKHGTSDAHEGR